METEDIADQIHEAKERKSLYTSMFIALLAMLLAVTSLGGNNASKEMINSNIEMADTYAFYQAKNIRQTVYKVAADELKLLALALPDGESEAAKQVRTRIEAYEATVARYESEPSTNEGKKELLTRAKHHQELRDTAMKRDPYFDYAEVLLQVSIVLASVSLITGSLMILGMGHVLAVLGSLLMLNGFTLLVEVPFLG